MEIRFAQKKDLPQIIALCKEHAEYEKAEYEPKNKFDLLSISIFGQNPVLSCLVVESENAIMGYATYTKQYSTWDASFYIYLDCLFLKEQTRGKGLGKVIMEKIKEYGKTQNCNSIQWQTPDFNERAIEFYNKIGGKSKSKERFYLNI
jgi:GNAT superfamily N-acetyltransferase